MSGIDLSPEDGSRARRPLAHRGPLVGDRVLMGAAEGGIYGQNISHEAAKIGVSGSR